MQALRGAAARLATVQRALPLLPAWALPALPSCSVSGSGALSAACRAGAPRGLFGCAGTLLPPAAGAAFAQRPAAAPGMPPGSARGISVLVDNNNIDKAMRRLKRRMIEEGVVKELKERQHYTKPSQQRVRSPSWPLNPKAPVWECAAPQAGALHASLRCALRA